MNEEVSASASFDYHALDTETRQFVQLKANETHGLLKRTAEHILRIGQNLKVVKEKLPHGQFLLWIEAEFEMSRWTARNFIRVADKLEDKWRNFHHLPVSVLYELAAPSTSEDILAQVQQGQIPPTLEAVKEAKEAERQAHRDREHMQQQLLTEREELLKKQARIEQLSDQITQLQEQIATLSSPRVEIKEVEKVVVPPGVETQIASLHQRLHALTQQRDTLAHQVTQLGEEARAAAQKRGEGDQEHRIRLNWYKATNEFRSSVTKILSQWPSPLDTLAFDAEDWTRLSQTIEITRRFLEECIALMRTRVVESTTPSTREEVR
jgi:cell division protein FtsB